MFRTVLLACVASALLVAAQGHSNAAPIGLELAQSGSSAPPAKPGSEPPSAAEPKPQIASPADDTRPERRPECMWIGQRIVSLLWRDDVNTAREQSNFYDRFKCPAEHLGLAFRCLIRQSERQPQQTDLGARVYGCWMAPEIAEQKPER
jgi:hypothetical protein